MEKQSWYVQQNGRVDGPVSQDIVELRIRNGIIDFETLVSLDSKTWEPARLMFDVELFNQSKRHPAVGMVNAVSSEKTTSEKTTQGGIGTIGAPKPNQSRALETFVFTDVFEWDLRNTITPAVVRLNFKFYIALWTILMVLNFIACFVGLFVGTFEIKIFSGIGMLLSFLFWYAGVMRIRISAERTLLGFNIYEEMKRSNP